LNICPKVIDNPFAIAGRYSFSHTVIGLRSTALALLVNVLIRIRAKIVK